MAALTKLTTFEPPGWSLVGELPDRVGQRVVVQGWVHRRRRLGGLSFLLVPDRSGVGQVVLPAGALAVLPEETVIAVEGTVTAREQPPGGVELTSPQVRALSAPAATPARAAVANGPLGEHDQARTLTEYILSRRRRILGDDHPDTLRTAAALTEIPPAFGETP